MLTSTSPGPGCGRVSGIEVLEPSAKTPHPTDRCRALSNISENDRAGKATESPAFTKLNCTEAGTTGRPARPTGRPDLAPGNPDERTRWC
jgi:hypothetical protein